MDKEDEFTDYITDVDMLTPDTKITEDGIVRHSSGILQDEKTGRFVKGNAPPGLPKKIKRLQQLIDNKTNGGDALVTQLLKIALYDPDVTTTEIDKKTGELVERKKRYHFINATTQMQAITLLAHYYFGPPATHKTIDKNVNINIEKKVADITQLINANKDRLKIVK